MHALQPTLMSVLWPVADGRARWLRPVLLAFAGAFAITVAAKIKVPFYPVHMTMQTFVVLAIGMAYGWRLGAATIALYLAQGAVGLPVFTGTPEKGIGVAYMVGPTGGYLLGYLMAALTTGWLAERGWDRNALTTAAAMLIGNVMIFAPGLLWLGILFGWDKPILAWGLTPFIWAEVFKMGLATAMLPMAWRLLSK